MRTLFKLSSAILFVLVVGCANIGGPAASLDEKSCVGMVINPPPGMLHETSDTLKLKLLTDAEQSLGEGGLCTGKVFVAQTPITVYRLWGTEVGGSKGNWWSLSYPENSRENYRKKNVMCTEWNQLNMMIACTLPANTAVVIGPGQSVSTCDNNILLPQSPANQVYIPDANRILENCSSTDWLGL